MATYGYARVSTDGRSVAAQVTALQDAGAQRVFRETASGTESDRAETVRRQNAPVSSFSASPSRSGARPRRGKNIKGTSGSVKLLSRPRLDVGPRPGADLCDGTKIRLSHNRRTSDLSAA